MVENDVIILLTLTPLMNFLNLLSAGTNLFNFNLNAADSSPVGSLLPTLTTSKTLTNEPLLKPPTQNVASQDNSKAPSDESKPSGSGGLTKSDQVDMFTQQQQLINQYMHLNIQLLSQKLEHLEHEKLPKPEEKEEKVDKSEPRCGKKKIKKINNCGHPQKEHYAKGMCNNCYHKYGRSKKPWNCPHSKLYANGMCQNCYINSYNRKRREERVEEGERSERKMESEEVVKAEEDEKSQ